MRIIDILICVFIFWNFGKCDEEKKENINKEKENKENVEEKKENVEKKEENNSYYIPLKTVPKLTDENFTNFTESVPYTLLYFHSPISCLTCEEVSEEISKANEILTHLDTPRYIAHIDVSEEEHTHNIRRTYPTNTLPRIILYSSIMNRYLNYVGPLTLKGFFTFVTKNTANSLVNNITDEKDIKTFLSPLTTYLAIVNFNENIVENIRNVSSRIPFALFGNCFSDLCKKILLPQSDIQIIKTFEIGDSRESVIPINFTSNLSLINNIMVNSLKRVGNLTSFATEVLFASSANSILYIRGKNEKNDNKKIETFLKSGIYLENNNNITYGFILDPMDNDDDFNLLKLLGFSVDDYENNSVVIILEFNKMSEYKIYEMKEKEKNSDTIISFIKSYVKGEIKNNLKSETEPLTQPKDNIRIIVGKNFDKEIIQRNNASFLLSFYSYDCKKCQSLEQIILDLGNTFENDTNIVFGITDFMANDIPNINSTELLLEPFIRYYYKDKSKGYEDYKGNFTFDEIKEWFSKFYNEENDVKNKNNEEKKEKKKENKNEKESDL